MKKPKNLPVVLSRNEISKILEALKNAKHKPLLSLAYGAGLRVSEVTTVKVQGLEELTIYIKKAKGQKNRISVMPESLVNDVKKLIAGKARSEFIFASERGGN